jgi:peptide/nickel transport system substrate-binding protein
VLIEGTGPLEIDSFDPTTGLKLSANPHWWGGPVRVKHVTVQLFANETDEALAFRAGEIDVAHDVLNPKAFASTSGANLVSTPAFSEGYFGMNYQQAPWNNIHVRRAVAYALNRADIIAAAAGYNVPVYTYYMPAYLRAMAPQAQVNGLLNSVPQYRYDVAAAKAELAKSAYPHGVSVVLHEYTYGSSVNTAEVVAAELQKVGINAQVKVDENTAWEASIVGPDAKRPSYFSTGYCGGPDISSCDTYLGSWNLAQGQQNSAAWAPPAVDGLLKAALGATSPAARFATYAQITKTIQADLPYIGLYQEGVSVGISSKFTVPGYAASPPLSMLNDYALFVKAAR